MRQCCGRLRVQAFTLLELLVVLAIVGLLLGILIPAASSIRRDMRVTACASNLRQIGQSIQAYVAESRAFPDARTMPLPWVPEQTNPKALFDVLGRQLPRSSGVYRCPGDGGQVFGRCTEAAAGVGTSYAYVYASLRASRTTNPPPAWRAVVAFDCGMEPLTNQWVRPQLHRGGSTNTLYADGSVQFEKVDIID